MKNSRTLRLNARKQDDLLFIQKVFGFNTHASDPGRPGICELLQEDGHRELYVVHRLDKGTSGALVFATTKEAAAELTEHFVQHRVKKRYLFLTDRSSKQTQFEIASLIEKKGAQFVSASSPNANARTRLRFLRKTKAGNLWEALPETGKPHQIRLHAASVGLPILGDEEHGGSPYGRLCLHSASLSFPWRGKDVSFTADEADWAATDISLKQALFLDAAHSRDRLFDLASAPDECLRLCHTESPTCRIDQFGSQLWVGWYDETPPDEGDLKVLTELGERKKKSVYVQRMHNRGKDPVAKDDWSLGEVQNRWQAKENGVSFELRIDQGLSAGLFLDQRENRLWVREHARDQKVLNLFSYTGGFSVCAALGGAKEVCTVDVSAKFNDWAKRNFEINDLDPKQAGFEFWAQDCMLFLKGAVKRDRKWDLVICDPPSFGRSKEGTFQIQKHLPEMLEMIFSRLNKGGRLLLSSNYEGWSLADLQRLVKAAGPRGGVEILSSPHAGLDYERPGAEALMKSLVALKK